jgi:AraC family transcriptional regulator
LPQHLHGTAYFELILKGYYEETTRTRHYPFAPMTVGFNPAGMEHDGAIGANDTLLFAVELDQEWIEPFATDPAMRQTVAHLDAGPLLWLGLRLYREYLQSADACPATVESLTWEMLGAAAQWKPSGNHRPNWWPRVEELLHQYFRQPLSVAGIAAEVGVHPVHLARVCRRIQGRTIGEYLQRLRLQFACQMLGEGELPISEVAAESGFSDQSHLTRTLQRFAHMTPARLRQMLLSSRRKSASALV